MGTPMALVVTLESRITRAGCVRDIRILSQTPYAEMNASAADALAKWTFEPGTLNGRPVDVLFNLSVSFRRP
jgi:TonB family protein